MNPEASQQAADAIAYWAEMAKREIEWAATHYTLPSAIYKPKLYQDGNQWCALYGDNLQDGVAGFGDSPALAMIDFDRAWNEKLQKKEKP